MTSFARGAAMMRAIFPAGSTTSIESELGSTKRAESPRKGSNPPPRVPYAAFVAAVVSATTAICFMFESSNTSCRRDGSLTSSLPPGSA